MLVRELEACGVFFTGEARLLSEAPILVVPWVAKAGKELKVASVRLPANTQAGSDAHED